MNGLIEKLKKNKTAFGLMSPEEQECMRKVGIENCLLYIERVYKRSTRWNKINSDKFLEMYTYAIKPEYQPEPEFVNLEIVLNKNDGLLGVCRRIAVIHSFLPFAFTHLHCLPSLPNFESFYRKDTCANVFIDRVSRCISNGNKVFARFRR